MTATSSTSTTPRKASPGSLPSRRQTHQRQARSPLPRCLSRARPHSRRKASKCRQGWRAIRWRWGMRGKQRPRTRTVWRLGIWWKFTRCVGLRSLMACVARLSCLRTPRPGVGASNPGTRTRTLTRKHSLCIILCMYVCVCVYVCVCTVHSLRLHSIQCCVSTQCTVCVYTVHTVCLYSAHCVSIQCTLCASAHCVSIQYTRR